MNATEPSKTIEAVTLALTLAITAPTEQQSRRAIKLAAGIAAGANFTDQDMEKAKGLALEAIDREEYATA